MKKILLSLSLLFLSISCSNDDSLSTDKEIIPGRNVYVAGYISDGSGNMTACYWRNGQRVDLGSGELSDIVVSDGKVYSVGYDFGGASTYWIDKVPFTLEGSGDEEAYSIAVYNGDVYTAGRDNGACYWKNTKKTQLSGGDSSGYGIAIKDNGDIFVGGYYQNNHHFVIPAAWKNGNRVNLSRPSGGDGEVYDVQIEDGTVYYFGMTMKPNNMLGYVPKASYWKGGNRTDLTNGGGSNQSIYGGEGYGGYVDGTDVYVAGKIDHIGHNDPDNPGGVLPGTGGTYAHYWFNGTKYDLLGGIWNNMWVSTANDIEVKDGYVVVAGDVATETITQVPAIWVNDQLLLLEGDIYGVAKAIFID